MSCVYPWKKGGGPEDMALALGRQGLGHLGMSETFSQELCEGIIGEEPPKNNQVTDC